MLIFEGWITASKVSHGESLVIMISPRQLSNYFFVSSSIEVNKLHEISKWYYLSNNQKASLGEYLSTCLKE